MIDSFPGVEIEVEVEVEKAVDATGWQWPSRPMATVFSSPDSRAVSTVAIGARFAKEPDMKSLIETALFKARAASDRASAHLEYVTMFASAGMMRQAEARRAAFEAESRMAEIYYAMVAELSV